MSDAQRPLWEQEESVETRAQSDGAGEISNRSV